MPDVQVKYKDKSFMVDSSLAEKANKGDTEAQGTIRDTYRTLKAKDIDIEHKFQPPQEDNVQNLRDRTIPAMEKTVNPSSYDPINRIKEAAGAYSTGDWKRGTAAALEGGGGLAADIGTGALIASAPEISIPTLLTRAALAAGGGYLGRKTGEFIGENDPTDKRFYGDVGEAAGGALGFSPKLSGALEGGLKGAGRYLYDSPRRIGMAGIGDWGLHAAGVPTPAIAALNAGALVKPAYEGGKLGAQGKPWLPALLKSAVSPENNSRGYQEPPMKEGEFTDQGKLEPANRPTTFYQGGKAQSKIPGVEQKTLPGEGQKLLNKPPRRMGPGTTTLDSSGKPVEIKGDIQKQIEGGGKTAKDTKGKFIRRGIDLGSDKPIESGPANLKQIEGGGKTDTSIHFEWPSRRKGKLKR